MEKETPYFDYELEKWLVLYSISIDEEKMQKTLSQGVVPLNLCNIISRLESVGYVGVIERKEPIYKNEGKILKHLGYTTEKHYSLTKKGKERLCFGWGFAGSAIPKEFWNEALENITQIRASITPPFI